MPLVKTISVPANPYNITSAPNGTLWFTENGTTPYIASVSTSGTGLTQYALPAGTDPQGLTVGPDGNLWFVGYGTSVVDKITPGGSITTYSLGSGSRPVRITTGSDGNLWVTESGSDRIARITTGGSITEFAVPTASALPWGITAGPDGNLWFTENGSGKIGRITTSGVITECSLGSCCQRPFDIVADPSDGNLWFTVSATSSAGPDHATGNDHRVRAADGECEPLWDHGRRGRLRSGGPRPPWARSARCPGSPAAQVVTTDPEDTQYLRLRRGPDRAAEWRRADFDPAGPQCALRDLQWGGWLWPGLERRLAIKPVVDLQLRHGRRAADHRNHLRERPNGPVPTSRSR